METGIVKKADWYEHGRHGCHNSSKSQVPALIKSSTELFSSFNLSTANPRERLEYLLKQKANKYCADCGSPDPKWASLSLGVFICIKCSGAHRSLGVHISKVLSVKLDDWTNEQVDILVDRGGNAAINMKYEAFIPENYRKPKPDSSSEERTDFIKRKYEMQQFMVPGNHNIHRLHSNRASNGKSYEKQHTGIRHAFRNSWRRKDEHKVSKKKLVQVYLTCICKWKFLASGPCHNLLKSS